MILSINSAFAPVGSAGDALSLIALSLPALLAHAKDFGSKRILIIQGPPDADAPHLCQALADNYAQGAMSAGHQIRRQDVAQLDFPLLRSQHDFENGTLPASLLGVQNDILWAEHLVLFSRCGRVTCLRF